MPRRKRHDSSKLRLSRQDWLAAARAALISGGIDSVKVERLANALNVTRGGFYWHFTDRADLLDSLLQAWEEETTALFEGTLGRDQANGMREFSALIQIWVEEKAYSPAHDSAVREWARTSDRAEAAVKRVDNHRIGVLKKIFLDMGYHDDEAFIRARITYFHQIGYYLLGLGETQEQRRKMLPLYIQILTGKTSSED